MTANTRGQLERLHDARLVAVEYEDNCVVLRFSDEGRGTIVLRMAGAVGLVVAPFLLGNIVDSAALLETATAKDLGLELEAATLFLERYPKVFTKATRLFLMSSSYGAEVVCAFDGDFAIS
jgi:hypothetical protein